MNPFPEKSRPLFSSHSVRGLFVRAMLAAGVLAAHSADGQSITIPNNSFENPTAGSPVSHIVDFWQNFPNPGYPLDDPAHPENGSWSDIAGIFQNPPSSSPSNHILNIDGNQSAYLLTFPGAGFYQDLSTTYTAGNSYTLTFALLGEANIGDTINLLLYYRSGPTLIPLGFTSVTDTAEAFPDITHFHDYSVTTPVVQAGNPEVGQSIGVAVVIGSGTPSFADWDVDNARLVATPAPEPTTFGLLVFGLGGFFLRRNRAPGRA